jgi:hypothetical protein
MKPFFIFLILVLCETTAHAYIDPGTGSIVLQMIIAGIAGGWLTLKLFWHRIKSFFQRKKDSQ